MAIIKINNNAIDLNAAEIPNLDAAKITTGQFADAKIADVASSKITGTITPSDNTVSLAKLTATGTQDATTFLRGDNTFAEAGGGKVLQVVTATDTTNRTVSSSSFTSTTVSASITPSATANKILILVSGMMSVSTSQSYGYLTVYRNATDLASTTANGLTGNYYAGDSPVNQNAGAISVSFLDSPSSTSATSYTVYIRTNASAVKFGVTSTQTITLIEIEG